MEKRLFFSYQEFREARAELRGPQQDEVGVRSQELLEGGDVFRGPGRRLHLTDGFHVEIVYLRVGNEPEGRIERPNE